VFRWDAAEEVQEEGRGLWREEEEWLSWRASCGYFSIVRESCRQGEAKPDGMYGAHSAKRQPSRPGAI
jgi:hypothetical protein